MENNGISPITPRVESFVVRFVQDAPRRASSIAPNWHGVVVHVQTDEEKSFSQIADAIAFMARYVSIGDFVFVSPSAPSPVRRTEEGKRVTEGE